MPGPEEFEQGLAALGLAFERHGGLVVTKLEVLTGPLAGETVGVGADPPPDYPRVPPHWVHLPSHVELADGGRNDSELGTGWSKWSRPVQGWRADAPAQQWLAYVRHLLEKASITI